MNQEDVDIALLDNEMTTSLRLEHINKMRAKRQNVRRPTIKHLQTKIELSSDDGISNEYKNYSDKSVIPIYESKNEITEPSKPPVISMKILEHVKLRLSNKNINVIENSEIKNNRTASQRLPHSMKASLRFSMCEAVKKDQSKSIIVQENSIKSEAKLIERSVEIPNTERLPLMRIKKTRQFLLPTLQSNATDEASKEKQNPIIQVKLRQRTILQKYDQNENQNIDTKRYSMFEKPTNKSSTNELMEKIIDDQPLEKPQSVRERIKMFDMN